MKTKCLYCPEGSDCKNCNNHTINCKRGLRQRYSWMRKEYPDYNILFMSIHGSQNYRMAGPNSDIDCYVVVLPKCEEVFRGKEISQTRIYIDGSHINIKDLNTFIKEIKKGSFNAMEFINPLIKPFILDNEFKKLMDYLKGKELMVNSQRLYMSIKGTIKGLLNKTDPKSVSRLAWLLFLAENLYIHNMDYQDAISLKYGDQLKEVRQIKFLMSNTESAEALQKYVQKYHDLFEEIDKPVFNALSEAVISEHIDDIVDNIYWQYIKKAKKDAK